MTAELSIPAVLQLAQICEYLAVVNGAKAAALNGGSIDPTLGTLIYLERTAVQNRYNLNPSDPTLRATANYLYSILTYQAQGQSIQNNLGGTPPSVTGPTNQSVTVGNTATFSVSVTGTAPFTYQWFLNGILIPGATSSSYAVINAQLSQNGGLYSVQVTNPVTTITSNQATLTVTAALVGFYYQGNTDFSTALMAGTDTVPYLGTFPITTGQPFTITFPDLGATEFIVIKYPATETTKTSYLNPPPSGPDGGPIPNIAYDENIFGGFKYIFSRQNNPFGLNSVNGQVKYS